MIFGEVATVLIKLEAYDEMTKFISAEFVANARLQGAFVSSQERYNKLSDCVTATDSFPDGELR